jgi:nucleoid-associated protein YgaU
MVVYKDARFAFIVILALMVLVVIIWGRSPNPEDVVLEEAEQQAVTAEEPAASAPGTERTPSSADTGTPSASERSEPQETLPPAESSAPPAAAAKAPRTIAGQDAQPHFEWPNETREDSATMVHDGTNVGEPPSVPIEEAQPTEEARRSSPRTRDASPASRRTTTRPGTLATHTVVKGDNYQELARKYYNDVSKWRVIYKANGVEPEKLIIDHKLRIPALNEPGDSTVYRRVTTTTRERSVTTRTTEPAGSSAKPYTVKKGDNFYRIALKVYDDASHWKTLYQHNRSQLPDPNDPSSLRAGTRIEIPKLASNN